MIGHRTTYVFRTNESYLVWIVSCSRNVLWDILTFFHIVQQKSSKKLYEANGGKEIPLILWTSKMTNIKYLKRFLNPKKHIIQVWSSTKQQSIADLVKSGFKTIFTNWNTLYLDCGMGSWVGEVRSLYITLPESNPEVNPLRTKHLKEICHFSVIH